MKKYLIIILSFLAFTFAQDSNISGYSRPKIGLVLSGGGALGFAHIGTLQLLDSLNIPIDYIAGTSMGGIAGGLYALGYNGKEIEKLIDGIGWTEIFTDMPERNLRSYFQKKDDGKYQFEFGFSKGNITVPTGLIHGQNISTIISNFTNKYEHIENFDNLPIPYRCVAVDLITGNEVVLKYGSISKALRSTMSIPSIFNPVVWGDSLLIDGGLLNNFPVDIVKAIGADLVIGVNVSQSLNSAESLNSALKILDRTIAIPAVIRSDKNKKDVDVYIEPDLTAFTVTDFFKTRARKGIVKQGKIAATNKIPELLTLMSDNNIPINNWHSFSNRTVRKIYIGGNKILSSDIIFEQLMINVGDQFSIDKLNEQISSLKMTQEIENIDFDFSLVGDNELDIFLQITENIVPTIYRISIRGNKSIPFSFIYRLLGINPKEYLDIDRINQQIDKLYGLGYFETINYEIEPINENSVHLIFVLKEASRSLLRLGFHYDETDKFIGAANLVSTKVLIPGVRFESTLRFSGIFDFRAKLYYPIRFNDISVYPFIQTYHKNLPINIFGTTGSKIAQYNDRSTSWSAGFGFLSVNNWATEIEYNTEFMNTSPNVALPDTSLFPSWDDELHKLQITTTLDKLDDIFLPSKGVLINAGFEGGLELFKSDVLYKKYELNIDYYKTFLKKHTFRLFTQFGYGKKDLPLYKWFYYGGPNRFVGIEKDELGYYRTSIFGIDYRLKLTDNLYIKTMFNVVPNYGGDFYPLETNAIAGYGFGIKYLTYLGPLELIFSRGDKIITGSNSEQKNVIYLNFGYKL